MEGIRDLGFPGLRLAVRSTLNPKLFRVKLSGFYQLGSGVGVYGGLGGSGLGVSALALWGFGLGLD